MQGTADFHHQIADAPLPQADPVFDDATAFDTAVDMFDPQPAIVERLVYSLRRGSNQGNTQNEKYPYYQSSIDFRCYPEMALFEPRRTDTRFDGDRVARTGPAHQATTP